MIFAPMVIKQEPVPSQNKAKEPLRVAGFRTAYVFDVAQTEGRPLPEFAKTTGDPKDYAEKLKALAARRGITIEYDSAIAPAQGMSIGAESGSCPAWEPPRSSQPLPTNSLTSSVSTTMMLRPCRK